MMDLSDTPDSGAERPLPPTLPYLPPPAAGAAMLPDASFAPVLTEGFAPYLPHAAAAMPKAETVVPIFDAAGMVAGSRPKVAAAYGDMPRGTDEGRAAAQKLRTDARRRKTRHKWLGRFVGVLVLGGVAAAGYVAFEAYQRDQDRQAAQRALDEDRGARLLPTDQTRAMLQELDDGATLDSDELDRVLEAGGVVARTDLALDEVMPPTLGAYATEVPEVDGLRRFLVPLESFQADPAYPGWLAEMQAQPQLEVGATELDVLPTIAAGEVAIAVRMDDGVLTQALVWAVDPALRVDYRP